MIDYVSLDTILSFHTLFFLKTAVERKRKKENVFEMYEIYLRYLLVITQGIPPRNH